MEAKAIWILSCHFHAWNIPADILRHIAAYYRRINAAKISESNGRISVYINGGIYLLMPIVTTKTKYNHLIIHACNESRSLIRKGTPTYRLKYRWTNLPGRYITHVTRDADIIVAMAGDHNDVLYRLTVKLQKYGAKHTPKHAPTDFLPNGFYEGTVTKYAEATGRIISVVSTRANIFVILQHDGSDASMGLLASRMHSDASGNRGHVENSRPQDDRHGLGPAPFQELAVIIIPRNNGKPRPDCAYFNQLGIGKNIAAIAYATHVCALIDGVYYRYDEIPYCKGADLVVAVSFPHPRKFVSLVCAGTHALMFDEIKYYEEAPSNIGFRPPTAPGVFDVMSAKTSAVSVRGSYTRSLTAQSCALEPRHERQLRETIPRCARNQHPSDAIFIGNGTHPVVATLQSIYLYRTINATSWYHTDGMRGLDYICDWDDLGGL